MKGYIYKIVNKVNNKVYIGQTYDISKRKSEHFNDLKNNRHSNQYLQNAWNKYGGENFELIIIEKCDLKDMDEREIYWIKHFNSMYNQYGYNIRSGGNNLFGSDNPFYGRHHSKETIEKMKETNIKRCNYQHSSEVMKNNQRWATVETLNPIIMIDDENMKAYLFYTLSSITRYMIKNGKSKANPESPCSVRFVLAYQKDKSRPKAITSYGYKWVSALDLIDNYLFKEFQTCGQGMYIRSNKASKLEHFIKDYFYNDKDTVIDLSYIYSLIIKKVLKLGYYTINDFKNIDKMSEETLKNCMQKLSNGK